MQDMLSLWARVMYLTWQHLSRAREARRRKSSRWCHAYWLSHAIHHDRFHDEVLLPPGSAVAVKVDLADVEAAPATRLMNMRSIGAIEIFTTNVTNARVLFVDNVRLTH